MSGKSLDSLVRHPRRLGFALFNIVVLVVIALWSGAAPQGGLADLPNYALANAGMILVLTTWIASWVAWAVMVLRRWCRRQATVQL